MINIGSFISKEMVKHFRNTNYYYNLLDHAK